MRTNRLATALALSDDDLLARVEALAGNEREAAAELVAHLAALELRPSLYAAQGYGSLFAYCTEVLRLSEDAACNRIEVARACRSFPSIVDLLASGSLTLTSVRRLGKHLTPENHEAVLARATHQRKEQIDALVAELAPKPDVMSSVRKLPALAPSSIGGREGELPALAHSSTGGEARELSMMGCAPGSVSAAASLLEMRNLTEPPLDSGAARDGNGFAASPPNGPTTPPLPPARHAVVQALAPERYRVQFTIGQETYEKLRCLQTLLRREVPNGDAGLIFERFIGVLLDKVERNKLGKSGKAKSARSGRRSTDAGAASVRTAPRSAEAGPANGAYENRIRSGTDRTNSRDTTTVQRPKATSRYIPSAVTRAVWFRDRAQCAFVADTGHRCSERTFLELHHIQPYALDGPATVGNVSLRCRRHNQYEAELVFGSRNMAEGDKCG